MTTQVHERAYFHIHNGGLSLQVQYEPREKDEDPTYTMFTLKGRLTSFGLGVDVELPLASPEIVYWLHEVTGRLLEKMLPLKDNGRYFVYEGDAALVGIEDCKPAGYHFYYNEKGIHYNGGNKVSATSEVASKEESIQVGSGYQQCDQVGSRGG
jgi:hypothetical protein